MAAKNLQRSFDRVARSLDSMLDSIDDIPDQIENAIEYPREMTEEDMELL